MKKIKYLFALIIFGLLIVSCSSDDEASEPTTPPTVNDDVTYEGSVKAIIDSNCIACHGDPLTNGATIPLLTKSQVQGAVTSSSLITRIQNGTMPPSGNISDVQIQAIIDWQSGGFQ